MTKISKKKPNTLPPMPAPLSAGTADIQNELGHAMEQLYLAIAKVDLLHDRVLILYSKDRPENVSYEFKWTDYLAWYISLMEPKEKDEALKNFSTKQLLKNLQDGEDSFTMDLSFLKPGGLTTWITIQAFMQYSSEEDAHAYIMVRRSGEKHLLKSIINQYVYNNCDYFIYLDAKNNSYTMFSHSTSGTPLPPSHCEDYSSELVKYARDFVVPEDQEMVIKEMQIPRVLDVLNNREVHSFYCGINDPVRGYTRKRLDYRFHDRAGQMILLSRTDVTDVYLEEQKHRQALHKALFQAQIDPLTGLLNYQATLDKIKDRLAYEDGPFALIFIDLDNFKGINDTLGHSEGDELLRQIALVLRTNTKDNDLVGRVGGDEFVVFLRWNYSIEEVKACAQGICDSVKNLSYATNQLFPVSCSIGIALAPKDGEDYQTLVRKADRLVYQAKKEGKNRYVF